MKVDAENSNGFSRMGLLKVRLAMLSTWQWWGRITERLLSRVSFMPKPKGRSNRETIRRYRLFTLC